jgi:hypothetical protein
MVGHALGLEARLIGLGCVKRLLPPLLAVAGQAAHGLLHL